MTTKKTVSIILLILGIVLFVYGSYVANEVTQREERISTAEQNEQEYRRPVLGPIRRHTRANAAENAQQRIDNAEDKVAQAQVTANRLRGTGIVIFIVGLGCLFFSFSRKKGNS